VYHPLGGGLVICPAELPNTTATAQVTGASVDNLKLVAVGDVGLRSRRRFRRYRP
jgi:TRAP-type uncharacterized transport system substrate-binding protein